MRARPTAILTTAEPDPTIRRHRRATFTADLCRPLPGDQEPLRRPRAVADPITVAIVGAASLPFLAADRLRVVTPILS